VKTDLVVHGVHLSLNLGRHLVSLLAGDLGDDVGLVLGSKSLLGPDGLDSVLVVVNVLLPLGRRRRGNKVGGRKGYKVSKGVEPRVKEGVTTKETEAGKEGETDLSIASAVSTCSCLVMCS
jgi:hypothetical protein